MGPLFQKVDTFLIYFILYSGGKSLLLLKLISLPCDDVYLQEQVLQQAYRHQELLLMMKLHLYLAIELHQP